VPAKARKGEESGGGGFGFEVEGTWRRDLLTLVPEADERGLARPCPYVVTLVPPFPGYLEGQEGARGGGGGAAAAELVRFVFFLQSVFFPALFVRSLSVLKESF
jgi:hypothetical protein